MNGKYSKHEVSGLDINIYIYISKAEAVLNMVLAMLVYTWGHWTLSGKQEEHNLKATLSYIGTSHKT